MGFWKGNALSLSYSRWQGASAHEFRSAYSNEKPEYINPSKALPPWGYRSKDSAMEDNDSLNLFSICTPGKGWFNGKSCGDGELLRAAAISR